MKEKELSILKDKLYESFFEHIDAVDNGISRYPRDVEAKYRSNGTDLISRVANMNPQWYESNTNNIMERFNKSMVMV